jgi:aspartate/methionine/tyrosine aminotransferase
MHEKAAERPAGLGTMIRPEALAAPESGIVEVFDYGRGRQGLIPLWVGEGDLATPAFICDAAARSLAAGETFYTYQGGIPELRGAIADYINCIYPAAAGSAAARPERFFVTVGGMQALQIAVRIAAGNGDEVIVPTPAWPNFHGALAVAGAAPVEVPLRYVEGAAADAARWQLDLGDLAAAVGPRTRAIVVNSPANPTGWTATRDELAALAGIAQRRGLWLIADEVYQRFFYAGSRAPSLYDLGEPGERTLLVNTFSKNWAMTGWRIGWLSAPPALGPVIENLIQYSSSGTPAFTQRAATTAIRGGDDFLALQVERARLGRDIVCDALRASPRVRFAEPDGSFYVFFTIDGEDDTRALALRLVDEARVGLAPGAAFGGPGSRFMRLCFARDAGQIREASRRLSGWLQR